MENRAQGLTHSFAVVAGPWCASEPGNGLRASVDRPRAVSSAIVRRLGTAGAWSRTCINLLSLARVYNYGMMNVIERRPFSELGDQQLLEQTRRLAANQRCIEVHILDHLDEIDRRGLALRRGFSSLFDYAVRELRFSDAAAQRRIQAMRLCRRHGWVRACLQSGELSMTSAAQLETTFAGAERAERQCRTAHRNVGQTRQLGLPAAPGEAGEQGEREPQSAPEFVPPAGECSGDAAAMNTPAEPVASHAAAQDRGATHAGALLRRPELNGNAAPFPAPSCDAVAVPVAGPAAPSSDDGPAPQRLPPAHLPASAPVVEPVQVVAPSRHTAARAPEPLRDDPVAELSPGTVSAAPLLHPQLQRELIEQAAGMSTRQVASLLAAAAPEVLPPRDTVRAVAPDRYTLKVSIDQECEQGLRRLKDLMSHVDPRMSWGDLVARLVRDAVARHDPRDGGRGQRRKGADSAGASPRRAPKETRAAGAAAGPAQRVNESSRRAPNRTCAVAAPAAPAQRGGGNTPAARGDTAAAERQNPIAMLANAAAPRQTAPDALADGALVGGAPSAASDALSDGARAGGVPSSAPAAAAAPRFAGGAAADGVVAGASVPVVTSAPEPALAHPLTGDRGAHQPEQWPAPLRIASMPALVCRTRRSSLRRRSRHSAYSLTADRASPQPEQRRTRPANLFTAATYPRRGATFPRRSGATSGCATVDAAVIAIRSPGGAAHLPICCRSTTCCRLPRGVARSRPTSKFNAVRGIMRSEWQCCAIGSSFPPPRGR